MTEETTQSPKKKGGWPKGKPRTRQTPVEREPLRAMPAGGPRRWSLKAGANWETNDVATQDGVDRYRIPQEDIPEGFDLQWVAVSVYGQPLTQERGQFERQGWTPVHQEDFDGLFNGRFMPKNTEGEINVGGQVLMARPLELTKKARARELKLAREQVQIKERAIYGGDIPGVSGADHPSTRNVNRIARDYERIQVPEDRGS